MAIDPMERRLAAIIVADICGYSRLTTIDEEGVVRRFNERVDTIIRPAIEKNGGRFVKHTGDGFIGEFQSVSAAFRCASEIQEAFVERNQQAAQAGRGPLLELRIGLDIGDIIMRDGDVFGNGVNIAARLEALASPNGICVSQRAREQLNQFEVSFVDLGDQKLKNIAGSVRAYQVQQGDAPGLMYMLRHRRVYRRAAVIGLLILGAIGIVIAYWIMNPGGVRDREAFLAEQLTEVNCSWLTISEFSDGEEGVQLSVSGASVAPGGSVRNTLLREAEQAGVPVERINVRGIVPMAPSQCQLMEGLQRYRYTGITRLEASETTIGGDEGVRFRLVFDPEELAQYTHIYSIDPSGEMIMAEDRASMVDRAYERDDGRLEVDYMSDHVGWGGIILMESDAPIDDDIVLSLVGSERQVPAFDEAAERDNWRFELVWLNSEGEEDDES
ncbi:adenylate/guanylate cyclase domain-containing protein [uncultured Parasphingopyxis sp.]|uniref:adenylate/guanylate cyclase domain-containing protein n=1 Tax=uncultured Parasphingopyxis sp. TaxID=1547918 RepID=UPI002636266F|nr:adenylate/guanylate cyclase domain-containing protein [uncultured Parasphingopyxis sp.]